jgi:WD40 repeat protein
VVWDLVGRACLPALDAHRGAISALVWSPDSRFLLTASADCTARLWRAADGKQQVRGLRTGG